MQGSRLDSHRALVLNSYYEPIRVVNWQRALVLVLADKVDILEEYEVEAHSVNQSFAIPAVVRLRAFGRLKQQIMKIKFSREHIFVRDENICQYCYKEFQSKELTMDHVLPVYRGGATSWTNIVACCKKCNQRKGGRTPTEAGFRLLKEPKAPRTKVLVPDLFAFKKKEIPPLWREYFPAL